MQLAKVIGMTVSTVKDAELVGVSLLVCAPVDVALGALDQAAFVAVDTVGAGVGETVLIAAGGAARTPERLRRVPTDAAIVAIVDSIQSETAEGDRRREPELRERPAPAKRARSSR